PWVTQTRSAPVARIASRSDGQSTWSERVNPRSTPRLRRLPRIAIQPDANAVDMLPNRRSHVDPPTDGGAMTRAPDLSARPEKEAAYVVLGSARPDSR